MIVLLQVCLIVLLLVFSAFFAGTETGVYRLSRLKLRIKAEQGIPHYKRLFKIMRDGQGLILSLLLGNNLVNYFITSLITIMLFTRLENNHAAEFYATLIVTPVVFIFGEIIPKNVFYHRANTLMPGLVWLNWFCLRLFTWSGAVPALKGIFRGLSILFRFKADTAKAIDATQRHQVHQIIHETQEEGLLSESQKDMMSRLIDVSGVSVSTVMVKIKDVEMVSVRADQAALLEHLKCNSHTRQLVYENDKSSILGFIRIYEVLGKTEPVENLYDSTLKLVEINRKRSVLEAINLLRMHHAKIALVVERVKHTKKPVGIVTISDLIEELTGELNP